MTTGFITYRELDLSLRLKRPRRNKVVKRRQPLQQTTHPNHIWGMYFVSGVLFDGRRQRLLTIVDLFTRECLGTMVDQSLKGSGVTEALEGITRFWDKPEPVARQRPLCYRN